MSEFTKTAARWTANSLPIYRVGAGIHTARRLSSDMRDPHERTWEFASKVAFDAATDKFDGWLASYAGPTRLGGYLDQLSDKAWFLTITRQFVANGELPKRYLYIPAARDLGTTAMRFYQQSQGIKTDADIVGKIKFNAQVGATIANCSPLSYQHPELIHALYEAATWASVGSGAEMLVNLSDKLNERYPEQPAAQFVVATTSRIVPLLEAA